MGTSSSHFLLLQALSPGTGRPQGDSLLWSPAKLSAEALHCPWQDLAPHWAHNSGSFGCQEVLSSLEGKPHTLQLCHLVPVPPFRVASSLHSTLQSCGTQEGGWILFQVKWGTKKTLLNGGGNVNRFIILSECFTAVCSPGYRRVRVEARVWAASLLG